MTTAPKRGGAFVDALIASARARRISSGAAPPNRATIKQSRKRKRGRPFVQPLQRSVLAAPGEYLRELSKSDKATLRVEARARALRTAMSWIEGDKTFLRDLLYLAGVKRRKNAPAPAVLELVALTVELEVHAGHPRTEGGAYERAAHWLRAKGFRCTALSVKDLYLKARRLGLVRKIEDKPRG
jgi:hypothetical protein